MKLTDPITQLPLIGPSKAELLTKLEISSVGDLLYHIPASYRDTSEIVPLSALNRETKQTVHVTIQSMRSVRLRGGRGRSLQKALVGDDSGSVEVIWFNQPYLPKTLPVGAEVLLSGKLNPKSIKPQLTAPDYEVVSEQGLGESVHLGRITPIYPLTAGISQKWLRSRVNYLLEHLHEVTDLSEKEQLSPSLRAKFDLIDLAQALQQIHFPENKNQITAARKRLAVDELLVIHRQLAAAKKRDQRQKAPALPTIVKQISQFAKALPFKLSPSQLNAIGEISHDLALQSPMRRLLQGDVGSGKTIVALVAALQALHAGYQVALLAPTTILAEQHFATFNKFLPKKFTCSLITSSTKYSLDLPKIDMVIGTHAVFHNKGRLFSKVGLVIIDEQHRFGVKQRRELLDFEENKSHPHLLYLTATPIPRSLALAIFGNLEISTIDKPSGRKTAITYLLPENKRPDAQIWIKDKIMSGGQVFWVYPLIDESEELPVHSVKEGFSELSKYFGRKRTGILHGQMSAAEKSELLRQFREHKLDLLVATSVVEVGLDIPAANVLVIENAERFGLAQLHQLRGRVGRNDQQSWCFLFTGENISATSAQRLQFFSKESNGIKVAEYDLENRGPGEVYGIKQAGIPDLKVAKFTNLRLLKLARDISGEIISGQAR